MYIQIKDGGIKLYPEESPVVWDETHYCAPERLTPEEADQFCVVLRVDTLAPSYDAITHGLREAAPAQVDGIWTQQWEVYPLPVEEVEANTAAQVARERAQAKARRAEAVEAITVTTQAGNTFDGDETSQNRMARAVIALNAAGVASVPWTLADNSVVPATAAELAEALALAGAAQSALWRIE